MYPVFIKVFQQVPFENYLVYWWGGRGEEWVISQKSEVWVGVRGSEDVICCRGKYGAGGKILGEFFKDQSLD